MEETIDLKELFQILKKRLVLIFVITFVATVVAGVVSYLFITPTFQVSTQLVVSSSSGDNQVNNAEVQGNIQLINTFNDILVSPAILGQVIEELGLNKTASQLQGQMSVGNSTSSQVMTLTVTDADPNLARDIANATAEVFAANVGDIMNVDNVSILAQAEVTDNMGPVSPRPMLNMVMALVVGLMVGVGLAFLLEYLDKTVKTEQDIDKLLELPVLGTIPMMIAEDMSQNRS